MDKQVLIEEISKTQDGDVLAKGFHDSDYLSKFIVESIKFREEDNDVDLDGLRSDLNYAIGELAKALEKVEELESK